MAAGGHQWRRPNVNTHADWPDDEKVCDPPPPGPTHTHTRRARCSLTFVGARGLLHLIAPAPGRRWAPDGCGPDRARAAQLASGAHKQRRRCGAGALATLATGPPVARQQPVRQVGRPVPLGARAVCVWPPQMTIAIILLIIGHWWSAVCVCVGPIGAWRLTSPIWFVWRARSDLIWSDLI